MNSTPSLISRRRFLGTAAATSLAAPFVLESSLRAAAPNSKLNHACIGVGGMGVGDLQNFKSHPRVQIVALCDVDANTLQAAAKEAPGARLYRDWRELLEKEGDRIDSVNVTVPDHMHYAIAMSAIRRGKHVYCQKPMCHDVAEVRALTEAAVKKRVVTQLGTQMAAGVGDRTTVHLISRSKPPTWTTETSDRHAIPRVPFFRLGFAPRACYGTAMSQTVSVRKSPPDL